MIIFNITTQVSWAIDEHWKRWMVEDCIPEMMSTGLFTRYQMVRLLELDEEEGPIYAVQMYMDKPSAIREYREKHLERFQQKQKEVWGDHAFTFTSLMEVIN